MAMTKKRRRLMDRLRKKFGWKTNTNYNRGTLLICPEATRYTMRRPMEIHDLAVYIDDYETRNRLFGINHGNDIVIYVTRCFYSKEEKRYISDLTLEAHMTFEELELIYNIAKEKELEIIAENTTMEE